mmetsp:Transcript_68334/g.187280  ORF Transcript_68334/g.187280 Transcript_68334/m.187280 type:complete len:456 (-) Transcript_68334:483-1850(-)
MHRLLPAAQGHLAVAHAAPAPDHPAPAQRPHRRRAAASGRGRREGVRPHRTRPQAGEGAVGWHAAQALCGDGSLVRHAQDRLCRRAHDRSRRRHAPLHLGPHPRGVEESRRAADDALHGRGRRTRPAHRHHGSGQDAGARLAPAPQVDPWRRLPRRAQGDQRDAVGDERRGDIAHAARAGAVLGGQAHALPPGHAYLRGRAGLRARQGVRRVRGSQGEPRPRDVHDVADLPRGCLPARRRGPQNQPQEAAPSRLHTAARNRRIRRPCPADGAGDPGRRVARGRRVGHRRERRGGGCVELRERGLLSQRVPQHLDEADPRRAAAECRHRTRAAGVHGAVHVLHARVDHPRALLLLPGLPRDPPARRRRACGGRGGRRDLRLRQRQRAPHLAGPGQAHAQDGLGLGHVHVPLRGWPEPPVSPFATTTRTKKALHQHHHHPPPPAQARACALSVGRPT